MLAKNKSLLASGILVMVAAVASQRCGGSGDNSTRTGSGGSAGTTGTGGSTGTGGTATGAGGAAGTGGTGAGTGGTSATGTGGSAGAGPEAGSPGTNVCPLPVTTVPSPLLYDGVTTAATCGTRISAPHVGYWFTYHDATDAGPTAMTGVGDFGGCGGTTDCAYHVVGSGFTVYGAGFGFDLNDDASTPPVAQPFDVTAAAGYTGLQFYAKGTITGTRGQTGMPYVAANQSLHVKFLTSTARGGDDYGAYCNVSATDWMLCKFNFAEAVRDGFANATVPVATDMFDRANLLKFQFEFSRFTDPPDAGTVTPVAFDVFVDNVSLF